MTVTRMLEWQKIFQTKVNSSGCPPTFQYISLASASERTMWHFAIWRSVQDMKHDNKFTFFLTLERCNWRTLIIPFLMTLSQSYRLLNLLLIPLLSLHNYGLKYGKFTYTCNELKSIRNKVFLILPEVEYCPLSKHITWRNFDCYNILNKLEQPWLSFKECQCILEVTFLLPFTVFNLFLLRVLWYISTVDESDYDF